MPIELDSDRAVFLNSEEFGTLALYAPATGDAVEIEGVLDRPTVEFAMNELGTLDVRPTFLCRASDLPETADAEDGDALTVDLKSYRVTSIEPDGQGMALLRLGAPE